MNLFLIDQLTVSPLLLVNFDLLLLGAVSLVILSHFENASSVSDVLLEFPFVVVLAA